MAPYLAFLLSLEVDDPHKPLIVDHDVAFAPTMTVPRTAFEWKVVRDGQDTVVVRAVEGRALVVIATATWQESGGTTQRKRRGKVPTKFQWGLIDRAITEAEAQARTTGVSDAPQLVEELSKRDTHGLVEAPVELDSTIRDEIRAEKRKQKGMKPRRDDDREWRGWDRPDPKRQDRWLVIGLLGMVAATGAVYLGVKFSAERSMKASAPAADTGVGMAAPTPPAPSPIASSDAATPAEPTSVEPEQHIARAEQLADAFRVAKADLQAIADGDMTPGAEQLARYPLRWRDVDVPASTTVAQAEKDPAAAQGKHLCASGTIDRILRRELYGRTHYVGALTTSEGDRVNFLVAGSTGELVKRTSARLCGVVTGLLDDAIAVYGMFDLPGNRNPVVERP